MCSSIEFDKEDWLIAVGDKRYSWGEFLAEIDPDIFTLTGSADKQMGYYFVKPDTTENGKRNVISDKVFINKVLFYLWTDVLKDYDLDKEPFVYETESKQRKPFRFTDFFGKDASANLAKFFGGMKIKPKDEKPTTETEQDVFDSADDSELNDVERNSQRDYSRYSVNGQGKMTKSDAVVAAMTAFIAALPGLSATEILAKIDKFNLSNKIAYSESEFNSYQENSNDPRFTKRYARVETSNGEPIYIYRGSTPKRINQLINGLSNSGVDVRLEKVD